MIAAPLKRLSICPCGFGTLRDGIQIGKLYELDLQQLRTATYVCAACGKRQIVDCVMSDGKWIPRDLFTPLSLKQEEDSI